MNQLSATPTLRAIIRRRVRDASSGAEMESFETVDFAAPVLDRVLRSGGYGEGYDIPTLIGVELLRPSGDSANAR